MSRIDYLPGTPYTIRQAEGMFHMTTDTVLLGRFLHLKHKDTILDIGCNQGVLMLYAAVHEPASLTGIDILAEAVSLARENLQANDVSGTVLRADARTFRSDPFSVIVCNPPYFVPDAQDRHTDEEKTARTEDTLTPDELFTAVKRLLKSNGALYLSYRANRLSDLLQTASQYGLRPVRMRFFHPDQSSPAKSAVLEMRFSGRAECIIEAPAYPADLQDGQKGDTEMKIVEASSQHLDEIADIYVANWKTTYAGLLSAAFLDRLDHAYGMNRWTGYQDDRQHILTALAADGTVAGFAAFKPDEHLEQCIYLDSLHVRDDCRGQGIGTALIKAAAARAFQDGYTRMSISIVRGNDHAGDLYRKLGARHLHYFTDHFEEAESRSEELLWDDIRVLLDD